jgi:hypothetical protein
MAIARKWDLKQHMEKYCYKRDEKSGVIARTKINLKIHGKVESEIDTVQMELLRENRELREELSRFRSTSDVSNLTGSTPNGPVMNGSRGSITIGNNNTANTTNNTASTTNVNITVVKNMDCEGDGNFHSKCFNLFEHVLGMYDGDTSRAISKIKGIFNKKRTPKTKYDFADLVNLLPAEKFRDKLTRDGKDVNGDYQYLCKINGQTNSCSSEYVDKILGIIIADAGLLTMNAAIRESTKYHENVYPNGDGDDDDNGGIARQLSTTHSDIYGRQGDDIITKINLYRHLRAEDKHLEHTVTKITV